MPDVRDGKVTRLVVTQRSGHRIVQAVENVDQLLAALERLAPLVPLSTEPTWQVEPA